MNKYGAEHEKENIFRMYAFMVSDENESEGAQSLSLVETNLPYEFWMLDCSDTWMQDLQQPCRKMGRSTSLSLRILEFGS